MMHTNADLGQIQFHVNLTKLSEQYRPRQNSQFQLSRPKRNRLTKSGLSL
jgi:hypothetical protein